MLIKICSYVILRQLPSNWWNCQYKWTFSHSRNKACFFQCWGLHPGQSRWVFYHWTTPPPSQRDDSPGFPPPPLDTTFQCIQINSTLFSNCAPAVPGRLWINHIQSRILCFIYTSPHSLDFRKPRLKFSKHNWVFIELTDILLCHSHQRQSFSYTIRIGTIGNIIWPCTLDAK
jgi:hypothetical protein